ncbi:thioredoxin domain-containing protein [Sulfurospirillum sp. T05]|uniref:Thioredoxin domain-containing protein n=1 Tax=Sulfurospirillum tamanense TaxID=2813362 RepID=A0ABS2WV21_9BACT|nr:thioredoxin domain-containing protein [Sulfurospirillum tamanensis]MBN2965497.1 thioredoxin domain-containing protein [Sulfurospirillum tamanensis]
MNQRLLVVASVVLLIVAFMFAAKQYQASQSAPTMSKEQQARLMPSYAPTLGPSDAKVTLVEFFDPACGTCAQFSPLTKALVKEYGGKLRLVLRYAPFHEGSETVVQMIEAAKAQGKYWEALSALLASQQTWVFNHRVFPERAWPVLEQAGVDIVALKEAMKDPKIQAIIAQDVADGKALGVSKTPSFFVNGTPLERFGYEPLVQLIKSYM